MMFKAVILLTRKDGMTKDEFREWMLVQHSPLAKQLPGLRKLVFNIVENEENPRYYSATFELRPHFQLEGMDIGLRLVSRLPAANPTKGIVSIRFSAASSPPWSESSARRRD